jgi:hypothetical protein
MLGVRTGTVKGSTALSAAVLTFALPASAGAAPLHGYEQLAGSNRRCSPRTWLRASGSTRWRFRLPRRLPRGVWTIYARATDAEGLRERSFTARDRNRPAVRIKAP